MQVNFLFRRPSSGIIRRAKGRGAITRHRAGNTCDSSASCHRAPCRRDASRLACTHPSAFASWAGPMISNDITIVDIVSGRRSTGTRGTNPTSSATRLSFASHARYPSVGGSRRHETFGDGDDVMPPATGDPPQYYMLLSRFVHNVGPLQQHRRTEAPRGCDGVVPANMPTCQPRCKPQPCTVRLTGLIESQGRDSGERDVERN